MRSNHIAQGFMQPGPEIPQGLRLHNLLATEPLPDCPNVGVPPSIPISICGHCLSATYLPSCLFSKVQVVYSQVPIATPSLA